MNTEDDRPATDEEGERNARVREETNVRNSTGDLDVGNETPKVTPESDVFKDEPAQRD